MNSPKLSYVAIVSKDVDATALFLGRHLKLPSLDRLAVTRSGDVRAFNANGIIIAAFPTGHSFVDNAVSAGVHHVGFAVDDRDEFLGRARGAGLEFAETRTRSALDGDGLALPSASTCGVQIVLCDDLEIEPAISGVVLGVDHVGIASLSNPDAIDVFADGFGCPLESQETDVQLQVTLEVLTSDRHGHTYHSSPPQYVGGLHCAFITVGGCELEFLQNHDPRVTARVEHGVAGAARQELDAIARFIETRGQGLHHVAFRVSDIDGTLASLGRAGLSMIDTIGRPGSRGGKVGFVHPRSTGGPVFHVTERH